jgi:diadenylate cyclase
MTELLWTLQNLRQAPLRNLLDVGLVALLFFGVFRLVRGTRAVTLLRGVAVLLVLVSALSSLLGLRAFTWLLSNTLPALVFAIPVIFQPELRQVLDRVGRLSTLIGTSTVSETDQSHVIDEITDAVDALARRRHGALIVLERETGLQEYIDTGVALESRTTSQLLQTIFFPNTALHDGAVIVRDWHAMAASCVLPLSTSRRIASGKTGLRHRAAMGISEVSDAVAIVVSEETGTISLTHDGRMYRRLDVTRLSTQLHTFFPGSGETTLSRFLTDSVRLVRSRSAGVASRIRS